MNRPLTSDSTRSSRIHVGLSTSDLERARAFYETLFGVAPTKVRPGYVKFEPTSPPVNLTLNEVAPSDGGEPAESAGPTANHFGIEVHSSEEVRAALERLGEAGLATFEERQTACCYAVQDKVWVHDPDGHAWEVFVVTAADHPERRAESSACCAPAEAPAAGSACCP